MSTSFLYEKMDIHYLDTHFEYSIRLCSYIS